MLFLASNLKMSKNLSNLRVPYGLSVYDEKEIQRVVKVLREKRSNTGIETLEFEKRVAKLFGTNYSVMVNSGSSANLLAIEISGFKRGDEVITPTLTFSTTVSPLIQKGIIPRFTDVKLDTYNIDESQIEKLITKKTKGILVPLLLGNLPNLKLIKKIARKHNLTLIIDSCDALGPKFDGKKLGKYSDIITTSFFGSHSITTGGNGGMVLVNKARDRDLLKVLRGWGRSSSLFGETEDIDKRFSLKVDGVKYDAKFVFQAAGYNFLPMEIGSAFGNEQLNKLAEFRRVRKMNYKILVKYFSKHADYFYLPREMKETDTMWHVFPLTIKSNKINRIKLMKHLESNNIQTRPIFTGNILRQPGFSGLNSGNRNFPVADLIMEKGLLIGVHHGLGKEHLVKIQDVFDSYLRLINKRV